MKAINQKCDGCEKPASPLKQEGGMWLCSACIADTKEEKK